MKDRTYWKTITGGPWKGRKHKVRVRQISPKATALRRKLALSLRYDGVTYRELAEVFGISHAAAQAVHEKALAEERRGLLRKTLRQSCGLI
jgi:DNA-directed RNA polymerase specialized sigma24 family protein